MTNFPSPPRVALVTGAGTGIGRAVTVLASEGVSCGPVGRTVPALEETADLLADHGGRTAVLPGDVTDPALSGSRGRRTKALTGPVAD